MGPVGSGGRPPGHRLQGDQRTLAGNRPPHTSSSLFEWGNGCVPETGPSAALDCLFLHRVLLRVRMLYYLKVEVLGEAASEALEGVSARYTTAALRCC